MNVESASAQQQLVTEHLTERRAVTMMVTMKMDTLAHVKATLSAAVEEVHATHERISITRNGQPVAVLMSQDDLDSMEETLEILRDPELVAELKQANADFEAGRAYPMEEVVAELRQLGRL